MLSVSSTKHSFFQIPYILATKLPFTNGRIPAGLSHPKHHIKYYNVEDIATQKIYSQSLPNSGTEPWPAGNSIAFVEYECENAKLTCCVSCLLQHIEVYLS